MDQEGRMVRLHEPDSRSQFRLKYVHHAGNFAGRDASRGLAKQSFEMVSSS